MSDTWDLQYGLDPLYDDSGDDPDQDGKTNLEEFNDNSDPSENTEPIQFTIRNLINNSTENGGSAKYSVRLPYKPLSNVSVWLESLDISEGTVWPQKLTFTPDNWNSVGHTLTARGVDDHEADGSQPYRIRLAKIMMNNAQINQTDYQEITVMNIDNDSPGVTVGELEGYQTACFRLPDLRIRKYGCF